MNLKHLLLAIPLSITAFPLTGQETETDSIRKYNLDEVVITAFRTRSDIRELPYSIQVLRKRDLETIPSNDLGDLLKKRSGVDIIDYTGLKSNIGMRGYSPTAHGFTYTLLLVDGMPAGTQNLSAIDLQDAEQVEVLKGPFSSFFGSGAMAGVVNILTPNSRGKISGSAELKAGSRSVGQAAVKLGGSLGKRLSFDFHAKAMTQRKDFRTGTTNLLKMTTLEKEVLDSLSFGKPFGNTTYDKYSAGYRLGFDLGSGWQLNLHQNLFSGRNVKMGGTFFSIYPAQQKNIIRLANSLIISGKTGIHSIRFSPWLTNEREDYFSDTSADRYVNAVNGTRTYGAILQDEMRWKSHTLVIGADNNSNVYRSAVWQTEGTPASPYVPDYANAATGLFTQYRLGLFGDRLDVSAGLRYDFIRFRVLETGNMETQAASDDYHTVNPNLGVRFTLLPGLSLHAGAGTAFLAPDAFQKTGIYAYESIYGKRIYKGNPGLKPENSRSAEAGIEFGNRAWNAGLALYGTTHTDMIVYDYTSWDTTTFRNSDKAVMTGLEGNLFFDFGSLAGYRYALRVYGSFNHLFKATVQVDTLEGDMKYVRKTNASFGIDFDNRKLSARLNARYIGHRFEDNWLYDYNYTTWEKVPYVNPDGIPIRPSLINSPVLEHPDFLVLDLSLGYTFFGRLRLGLDILNLTDENYTEKDAYNMPGRMYLGSLTYRF